MSLDETINGEVARLESSTVGCVSPNGFQVLQDLREEGEIDSDGNDGADEVHAGSDGEIKDDGVMETEIQAGYKPIAATEVIPVAETVAKGGEGTNPTGRRGNTTRSRGVGSKIVFANSKSIVQASAQAQKGSHQTKKASTRKF